MPADPLWINGGKSTSIGTATIAAATDLFTIASHGLASGDHVLVDTLTGGAVGVLVTNGVYFVRDVLTNTFALSETLAGPPLLFASDGGAAVYRYAPQYSAAELRRGFASLITAAGGVDKFGARSGLRPGAGIVTLAGTTVTVENLTGVVYPGLSTTAGPYIVQLPTRTHTLSAPDGTNPRKDIVVLRIWDNDEDAGGLRECDTALVNGTPAGSPAEPAVPASSIRIATITVPQSGGGSATIAFNAPFAVAPGAIIPIRTVADLPTTGLHEGLYVDQADTDELKRYNGSTWDVLAAAPTDWTSYTPTITGHGSATFSSLTGQWKKLAHKTYAVNIYFVVSAVGSGSSNVTVTAPISIHRTIRQIIPGNAEGAATESMRNITAVALVSGSGTTFDRLRWDDGSATNGLENVTGAMLASGLIVSLNGIIREA